ncbi:Ferredoxin subunit of nitrite reductase or a ring-hydroxylating dioxygenase [Streptomyces sp. DvalAA-14]|uniref:Rieske (2Fe-2S) protein n=1 Tax=unclassified Streptomyces TaxID=2593676 RepID=UPI00081B3390|nr:MULTISPECIES: Rieske (2Fe-2S) protein [unclassified Streptomyces]MYS19144.1 Rieske 2Fe-2S domain-containing protein [Streptomyces sp. SID4948]SCD37799.1 Ferredoxin subunit of nitrite reductase or a ring-hydroxylating dioxygenase [Streptomyces sp. DvalAA-14]
MPETSGFPVSPTRRGVVAAAGGVGLAAVLTACGSGSDSDSSSKASSPSSDAAAPATTGSGSTSAAAGGGTALAKTSDIPVGGGKIFDDQKVVVTQPTAGQFKGFSAICTHMGCTVASVSGGTINCPCHGSKYHVADGSVANGPATQGLPAKQVTVAGDEITLA